MEYTVKYIRLLKINFKLVVAQLEAECVYPKDTHVCAQLKSLSSVFLQDDIKLEASICLS